jgi:transcriptional regulator GlxA family with amidase domain
MQTAQYIYRHNGAVRVGELANQSGLSLRQYERRFVTEIGFTPKLFARIKRFEAALDMKRTVPDLSWMTVAHQLGYFDQMHLIHDFQNLAGDTPSGIFQQSRDSQPWSLAAPKSPHHLAEPGHSSRLRR